MPALPPAITNLLDRLKQLPQTILSKLPLSKLSGFKLGGSKLAGSKRASSKLADADPSSKDGFATGGFDSDRWDEDRFDSDLFDSGSSGFKQAEFKQPESKVADLVKRLKELPRPSPKIAIAAGVPTLILLVAAYMWLTAPPPRENNNEIVLAVPPEVSESTAPAWEAMVDEGGADADLIERGPTGPLPITAADGRSSWQVYAHPFDLSDHRPRIAIVIGGLGLRATETQAAIDTLPPGVTLCFTPYAPGLVSWVARARHAGHEVLIGLPMASVSYPQDDPGPQTLLTNLSPKQNLDRLELILGRAVAYVGVTNIAGSRFTATREVLKPILEAVKGRGLLFLEHRSSSRSIVPTIANDLSLMHAIEDQAIDDEPTRSAIDRNLGEIEKTARRNGSAIGIGDVSYPITLNRLSAWLTTLEKKGLALAPITAVTRHVVDIHKETAR